MFIDVDHFKALNDQVGHPAGDACLRRIAQVLRTHTRKEEDCVGRYGGEEFTLLLPDVSADEATGPRPAAGIGWCSKGCESRSGAAVGHVRPEVRRGRLRQSLTTGLRLPGCRNGGEQLFEWRQIAPLFRRFQGGFRQVVARNVEGVGFLHGGLASGNWQGVPGQALAPAFEPAGNGSRLAEPSQQARGVRFDGVGQMTEGEGEIGAAGVQKGEPVFDQAGIVFIC